MRAYLIVGFLLAILAAVFSWQNPGPLHIQFLKWQFDGSVSFLCTLFFALGFLTHVFLSLATNLKRRWIIHKQEKTIGDLKDELAEKEKRPIFDKQPLV
jgi:uncharacterized integral membrane protein